MPAVASQSPSYFSVPSLKRWSGGALQSHTEDDALTSFGLRQPKLGSAAAICPVAKEVWEEQLSPLRSVVKYIGDTGQKQLCTSYSAGQRKATFAVRVWLEQAPSTMYMLLAQLGKLDQGDPSAPWPAPWLLYDGCLSLLGHSVHRSPPSSGFHRLPIEAQPYIGMVSTAKGL